MATAHVFGDNVDTDVIIPAQHAMSMDPDALGAHCMAGVDPSFADRVEPGDVVVAGENFGSGSSREHAPVAIQGADVAAVVAESFARIFYRNAINVGLPVLEVAGVTDAVADGDAVTVDPAAGTVVVESTGETLSSAGHPPFVREIIDAGGLVEYGKGLTEADRVTPDDRD